MPGFTTHYLFGVDAYKKINNPKLKQKIGDNHCAFALGLQGPDVFFYYLPSYYLCPKGLGDLAHHKDTGLFFANLLDSRELFWGDSFKQAIADAYIIGYIGHYTLDCIIHPYVYAVTKYDPKQPKKLTEYFGQHTYFETEIDNELLFMKKKIYPSKFHQDHTVALTSEEREVIAQMLTYAYNNTYSGVHITKRNVIGASKWMKLGSKLLNDPSGRKKVLVRFTEKLLIGNPFISPMVASDTYRFVDDPLNLAHRRWYHPWTHNASEESFMDLYKKAELLYHHRICDFHMLISNGFTEQGRMEFCHSYGNRSFLSGQPL